MAGPALRVEKYIHLGKKTDQNTEDLKCLYHPILFCVLQGRFGTVIQKGSEHCDSG